MKHSTVESYLTSFPEETKKILRTLLSVIREEVPGAEEVISYGMPAFKRDGKYVVYFAGFKNHISLFPVFDEIVPQAPSGIVYKKSGKGTIQFPLDTPLPLPFIRKIVQNLVVAHKKRLQGK